MLTSYRYRSQLRMPRNARLEAVCCWLYDAVVHGNAPGQGPGSGLRSSGGRAVVWGW